MDCNDVLWLIVSVLVVSLILRLSRRFLRRKVVFDCEVQSERPLARDRLLRYLMHKIQTSTSLEEVKIVALVVQDIIDSEC